MKGTLRAVLIVALSILSIDDTASSIDEYDSKRLTTLHETVMLNVYDNFVKAIQDEQYKVYYDTLMVQQEKVEFMVELDRVANKLNTKSIYFLYVMHIESRINPKAVNKINKKHKGLIQISKRTAKWLDIDFDSIDYKSRIQQIRYIEKYYSKMKYDLSTLENVYLYTAFPIAINKPDSFIFKTNNKSAKLIATQNPLWDVNNDGMVQKYEIKRFLNETIKTN